MKTGVMELKKIVLCCEKSGGVSDASEILWGLDSLDVIVCEEGVDKAAELCKEEEAGVLIVNLSDLQDNSHVTLLRMQTELPNTVVLMLGTTLEYTAFLGKFLGNAPAQLERPTEPEKVIKTVSRALSLSEEETEKLVQSVLMPRFDARPKILLVDDNAMLLRSLKKQLDSDYKVYLATGGEAALRLMKKIVPDVVLLDYEMPGMNGKEVLEKVRRDRILSHLKVIFVTGISDAAQISAVMSLKPEGYLLKPVNKEKLDAAIKATFLGKSANTGV